jgi:lipopolysaccharide biosynthesis protein
LSYTINLIKPNDKVAVILWLYHTDLWPEFLNLLLPLSDSIKLYLGLSSLKNNTHILQDLEKTNISYDIYIHSNYGVDVAPFLNQLSSIKEELFVKIHSKISLLGKKKQIAWRHALVYDLIGTPQILQQNIKSFAENSNIGMISNKNLLLKNQESTNSGHIQYLCKSLDIEYDKVKNGQFIGGNMFMSRASIFKKYFNMNSISKLDHELSYEIGKVNDNKHGSLSHSLERIFGYIITNEGSEFASPQHEHIKIINSEAESGYYKLLKLYDNFCYLLEDINAFGKIIEENNSELTIAWKHTGSIIHQRYNKLANGSIQKIQ